MTALPLHPDTDMSLPGQVSQDSELAEWAVLLSKSTGLIPKRYIQMGL